MSSNLNPDLDIEEFGYDGILFYVDQEKLNIYQCKYIGYRSVNNSGYLTDHFIFYINLVKFDTREKTLNIYFTYQEALDRLKRIIEKESIEYSKDVKKMEQDLEIKKNRLEAINKKLMLF